MCDDNLPVLVEPVVDLGLDLKRVTEVGGAGRGNPVHRAISGQQVVCQFLVLAIIVLLHDTEVTVGSYTNKSIR